MSGSEVFAGRYVSTRELARGGMGRVLLAEDRLLHRPVAVKTVLDPRVPDLLLRFVEEAQLTGQLAHPNVVPVFELGREGQHPFLAMKLVEGRDLGAILGELRTGDARALREWPLTRLLRAFVQACQAMAHAHTLGVIHRDLKPANLMLGAGDELLVMDWGLARPWAEGLPGGETLVSDARRAVSSSGERNPDGGAAGLTMVGAVVGTPAYMPVEQAEGGIPLDPRADVYALGAILYHILALRPPYEGSSAATILTQLFRAPPPPPSAAAPAGREVPKALESIVLRAMHRERQGRYPDAGALLEAVEAYLDDRRVEGHQESPLEALRRLARRHRAALLVLLATLGLLLSGATAAVLVVRGWARTAEAERTRAEEAREAAAREAASAGAVGAATREGEQAIRAALDLERLCGLPLPLERLFTAHAAARGEVERRGAALQAALEEAGQALSPAAAAELRAPAREAARRIDLALAQVLAGRAPRQGLEPPAGRTGLRDLDLGDERPTFVARAQLRLGRRTEALAALQGAPAPADPAARAAREALELVVRDERPLAAQLAGLEQALAADPGSAWLLLLRAELRARRGEVEAAQADAERARALEPADPGPSLLQLRRLLPVHANWLLLRVETDLVARLAPDLDPLARCVEAVRHSGTSFMATWRREEQGKEPGGIEPSLVRRMERGELDRGEGATLLAEAAVLLGRGPDAARWAEQALRARGERGDREAQGLLAEGLRLAGRAEEALATAEAGLRRWPDDGRLAWVRGALRLAEGRAESALPDLRLGAQAGRDPWRWEALARALLQVGAPEALDEGVRAARAALSLEPLDTANLTPWDPPQAWDPRLQRTLGDLRVKQGHHGLAALHYTRALLRARVLGAERKQPPDLSDALRAGAALDALELPQDAARFYQIAAQAPDPQVRAEAERRLNQR